MDRYEQWAPFYDAMRGDQSEPVDFARRLIERYRPGARTLLELGCGTGAVLERLRDGYDVSGVDASRAMLRVARRKLPGVPLLHGDATRLRLGERFDAVLCLADVVNHLRPFRRWEALFARAHEHLADGGVFVFDLNTQLHLGELAAAPPLAEWSPDGDLTLLDVVEARGGAVAVEVSVFERTRGPGYRLHTARIEEISYPVERVLASLRRRFRRVHVHDAERRRPSPRSERLHFACLR